MLRRGFGLWLLLGTGVAVATPPCPIATESTGALTLERVFEDGVEVTDLTAYEGYEVSVIGQGEHNHLRVATANDRSDFGSRVVLTENYRAKQ